MRCVVDSNIIISALIKKGVSRFLLFDFNAEFITSAYTLSEIEKHKKEILKKSGLSENEYQRLVEITFRYIKIISPNKYNFEMDKARKLIKDSDDVIFLARAIAFNYPIWTDDKHFLEQKEIEIITTKRMINLANG